MTLPNHIAGGFVFTGVFAGICGINILESPTLILMTVAASTVADVDVPSSLWGRILRPMSRWINRRYGHRTLTHSLLFLCLTWGLVWSATRLSGSSLPYPTVFALGFISHLLFDMMTVQGVMLLYPYSKSPCVIPGDPHLRLKTNNPGSELMVFGFFVLSGLFMQPLMADGFWTSYNRLFGTLAHLQSEFEKSDDLLLVNYRYREASQEYAGRGYAIEATGNSTTLWSEQGGWEYLDGSATSSRTILEVIPNHTGKSFELVHQSFVSISADSLERLLENQVVYQLRFSGNKPLEAVFVAREGREEGRRTTFDLSLLESIHLREIPSTKAVQRVSFRSSPRIATLQAKQRKLRREQSKAAEDWLAHNRKIEKLDAELNTAQDIYRRTQLLDQLKELRKQKQKPDELGDQLREVEIQLQEQQARDLLDNEDRLATAAEKRAAETSPLFLSGVATLVEFHSTPLIK